ncbi:Ku protein [Streptomyces sp. NPDC050560]|uniref:non-homologous end joining protein Ku n=1 Tax=Streptomyces sp. NPDC050560 TaxID=3365630 RepID=UPI00379C91C6
MARPVWTGTLAFGLVSLPVGLYTATDSHTIRFHQMQRGTSDRVRNRRVNERTGKEVAPDDIVKGYDAGDAYVVVEPEELRDVAPGRSQALEVSGFVDLDEIPPVFFDRTYYLGPRGNAHDKVYALLVTALDRTGRAAMATFVMRSKEYLVAVQAEDGVLALHTLHWADEVRDPRRVVEGLPEEAGYSEGELDTARRLIDTLSMQWRPEDFHDTFQERVAELVRAKQAGEPVAKAEAPAEPTNVVDLMDALRASVDRAKGPGGGGPGGHGGRGARRPGAGRGRGGRGSSGGGRRGGGSGARREPLEDMTKAELYRRAADAGVEGRSGMNRRELIEALGGGRQRRTAS